MTTASTNKINYYNIISDADTDNLNAINEKIPEIQGRAVVLVNYNTLITTKKIYTISNNAIVEIADVLDIVNFDDVLQENNAPRYDLNWEVEKFHLLLGSYIVVTDKGTFFALHTNNYEDFVSAFYPITNLKSKVKNVSADTNLFEVVGILETEDECFIFQPEHGEIAAIPQEVVKSGIDRIRIANPYFQLISNKDGETWAVTKVDCNVNCQLIPECQIDDSSRLYPCRDFGKGQFAIVIHNSSGSVFFANTRVNYKKGTSEIFVGQYAPTKDLDIDYDAKHSTITLSADSYVATIEV